MFRQINKHIARNLYNKNLTFIAVPANMRPDSFLATKIEKGDYSFETWYVVYSVYNCNAETGRYVRFYLEE